MFIPRRPLGIFLMIMAFLVLTVISIIRYSHNVDSVKNIQAQPWYRLANLGWKISDNFFNSLLSGKNEIDTSNDLVNNDLSGLSNDKSKNIQLLRNDNNWQLILQNNNGLILDKSWPRLFKNKEQ